MSKNAIITLGNSKHRVLLLGFCMAFLALLIFVFCTYQSAKKPISYLPDIKFLEDLNDRSESFHYKLQNSFFVLLIDSKGRIIIKSPDDEIIMSDLTFFASYDGSEDKLDLENLSIKLINDSTISVTGETLPSVQVEILLSFHHNVPKLDVFVKTHYLKSVKVIREALVARFDVPVTEVYRKNRQLDNKAYESEYWLDKQGVRFGNLERSAMIYHTQEVSSLQLDVEKRLLFINLEYKFDHPHISIPYQADGKHSWLDMSEAKYNEGDERTNKFSIYFGKIPQAIPRLMLIPHGFLAGYVFTEHADESSLQSQRAVYFGSENIENLNNATGGFAAYKIPVTKSVFYDDNNLGVSIQQDPQFLSFLDQLYSTGLYDICLHTPDNLNSNRAKLEESIKFMKGRFNTVTWIDHGMYSGITNRESFVCDGLNSESVYYSADLWDKYQTSFFWNTANEIIHSNNREQISNNKLYQSLVRSWKKYLSPRELKEKGFIVSAYELFKRRFSARQELNTLNPRKGDSFPTPLYYLHPTQTGKFYSWVTDYVKLYDNISHHTINVEKRLLSSLVDDRGIFIDHGYYPRIRPGKDVVNEVHGEVLIDPYFDSRLQYMAKLRANGELYITTIRDLLNYWIMIEKITFEYLPNGDIIIQNRNDKIIRGLSIAIYASDILIIGKTPESKIIGTDIVLWFDIEAGEKVILKINN